MATVENFKLVVCNVRGSLIPGVEWAEVPNTRTVFAGIVPESECEDLPEHCFVDGRFVHVTKLNINFQNGEEVLEVCHQQAEGHSIQSEIY